MARALTRAELDERVIGRLSQYVGEVAIVGRAVSNARPRRYEIEDPVIYKAGGRVSRPTPSDAFYLSVIGRKAYRVYITWAEEVFDNGTA